MEFESPQPGYHAGFLRERFLVMAPQLQRQRENEDVPVSLDLAIRGLNLAKDLSEIPPANVAFGSVGALLATIRVRLP